MAAAHDMQGAIRGLAQLCDLLGRDATGLPAETIRLVNAARERAWRLYRLARDTLELVRPTADRCAGLYADPVAILRDAIADLAPHLASFRPRFHIGELPPLAVSPSDLHRLLSNLIENALRYRSLVKPRVTVTAECCGTFVQLSVGDNGIGIPAHAREHVFKPFVRLATAAGGVRGSGLGLAICRAIVESYDGRIWIEDGDGGGSRISFILPAAKSPAYAATSTPDGTELA